MGDIFDQVAAKPPATGDIFDQVTAKAPQMAPPPGLTGIKPPTNPILADSGPSVTDILRQPTQDTDNSYLSQKGAPGVAAATVKGLNDVASGTIGAVKGAANQVMHPLDTLKSLSTPLGMAQGLTGVTQVPSAIRDINASPDPMTHYAQAASDTAGQGAGQSLLALAGHGVSEVAPKVVATGGNILKGAAKASGIGLSPIEKLVKAAGPSVRDANFPQSLETASPELARQNAASPVKTVQDMSDAAHTGAQRLWTQEIEPQITRNASQTIDAKPIADQIRGGIGEGMTDLFPDQAKAANALADKFNGPIKLSTANEYLKTLNANLKSYYRMSPEGRAAAGVTDGRISSMENAADSLRQQMYSKLDSLGETDPAGLRQQYGALKQVQTVFGKRAIVSGRSAPMNLTQMMALAGGAGEGAAAMFNGHPGAAVAGAVPYATATALKYLNSPDMLTRRGVGGLAMPEVAAAPTFRGGQTMPDATPSAPASTVPAPLAPAAAPSTSGPQVMPDQLRSVLSGSQDPAMADLNAQMKGRQAELAAKYPVQPLNPKPAAPSNPVNVAPMSERPGRAILGIKVNGVRAGQMSISPVPELGNGAVEMSTSQLGADFQGKGHGTEAYNQAIDYAKSKGAKTIFSDDQVKPGAANVWESLAKKGVAVWDPVVNRYRIKL
jgi:GNAT superfamily N-acetyltransferase